MAVENVSARLTEVARRQGAQTAIAQVAGKSRRSGQRAYTTIDFAELENRVASIASGLQQMGVGPGHRMVLLVRFNQDFIALVFALLRVGATLVLIDPGMGRRHLLGCLQAVSPDGFVAIPAAHAVRWWFRDRFPNARFLVTAGPKLGIFPSPTLAQLERSRTSDLRIPATTFDDPAAIIFTTGSTGPPKGVLYTHQTFHQQIDQIQQHYGIQPGGRDLSAFPLFGLFNAMMGTTTILPDMDPTRPADADPMRLLDAIDQWDINQSFGSPALWTRVGRHCQKTGRKIASLQRVLSAGAPVAPHILQLMRDAMPPSATMHTPYGATEALPIASIESREVLEETAARTRQGAGTCVGRRFDKVDWRVIPIADEPIPKIESCRFLPTGQIGELIVRGPQVTRTYVTRTDQNALHKIADGDTFWHRMGDVGYLDEQDRFWFCGRKSHRVEAADRTLFTEPCEAILATHPVVHRAALVQAGNQARKLPVLIAEPWPDQMPASANARQQLAQQLLAHYQSARPEDSIHRVLIYPGRLPTDIRHNAKIFREQLGPWAAKILREDP
jgi:acyl-CoA synthetase (AMP-forming)/AMP-acid ligase II